MLNGYHVEPEKKTKRIDQINALLTRLQNYEEIQELHYDNYDRKYGEFEWEFEDIPGKNLSRMNTTNARRETHQARKEFLAIREHVNYMYYQDLELLAKLLKKHLRNFWE